MSGLPLYLSKHTFIDLPDSSTVELLVYGSPDLSFTQNSLIPNATINYIIKSECFKRNLS